MSGEPKTFAVGRQTGHVVRLLAIAHCSGSRPCQAEERENSGSEPDRYSTSCRPRMSAERGRTSTGQKAGQHLALSESDRNSRRWFCRSRNPLTFCGMLARWRYRSSATIPDNRSLNSVTYSPAAASTEASDGASTSCPAWTDMPSLPTPPSIVTSRIKVPVKSPARPASSVRKVEPASSTEAKTTRASAHVAAVEFTSSPECRTNLHTVMSHCDTTSVSPRGPGVETVAEMLRLAAEPRDRYAVRNVAMLRDVRPGPTGLRGRQARRVGPGA